VQQEGRRINTGLIVDRVSEVLTVPGDKIEDAPNFGSGVDTNFILGLGKSGPRLFNPNSPSTSGRHFGLGSRPGRIRWQRHRRQGNDVMAAQTLSMPTGFDGVANFPEAENEVGVDSEPKFGASRSCRRERSRLADTVDNEARIDPAPSCCTSTTMMQVSSPRGAGSIPNLARRSRTLMT